MWFELCLDIRLCYSMHPRRWYTSCVYVFSLYMFHMWYAILKTVQLLYNRCRYQYQCSDQLLDFKREQLRVPSTISSYHHAQCRVCSFTFLVQFFHVHYHAHMHTWRKIGNESPRNELNGAKWKTHTYGWDQHQTQTHKWDIFINTNIYTHTPTLYTHTFVQFHHIRWVCAYFFAGN